MRNLTIYLTAFLCLFLTKVLSQETFEAQISQIALNIENITKEEKEALKIKIEAVNLLLENGQMTKEQADAEKIRLAESSAKAIEFRVAKEQQELNNLVQKKVDGKIQSDDSDRRYTFTFPDMKVNDKCNIKEKRTTTQLVFAVGGNNLVTNGAVANSEFMYWTSYFEEFGFTFNTRLLNNNNLLHLKYGLSLMKNNLRPSDNQYFVKDGNETYLETFPVELEDSRFKNNYLVVPLHLEFDFSKNKSHDEDTYFRSQKGFRFGLGGYSGFRTKSKQKLYYKEDDDKIRIKTKGNFNVNDFIYGVSTYVGYKDVSLYLKYDLNPLFEKNDVEQNNISLGLRFDFY
jgi:hypothetical protein